MMNVFPPGSRVQVISYGPYRRLKGTIRAVDMIAADLDEPFCFYHIVFEGTYVQEPIWFEYDEVELVGPPLLAPQALHRLLN